MRLFSAVVPPPHAVAGLAEATEAVLGRAAGITRTAPERWHITLSFYGENDPADRAAWLHERLAGAPAPRLRLAGFDRFPGVVFAAVQDDPAGSLAALGHRAGADQDYHPHLTVARCRRGRMSLRHSGYTGDWFTPADAVLMASEAGRYRVLARCPLDPG